MKRSLHYVAILFVVALLGMWGCPKKTEVSSSPETSPTAETAKQQPSEEAFKPAGEMTSTEHAKAEPTDSGREGSGMTAEGLKPVYFDYDKSTIRDDQKEVLRADASWLKAHPKVKIRIEGNCDERGTREYNQALGQRRAVSAKKYLTTLGIPAARISLISYGKEKPVCTEDAESCWQKNRKDDFAVTKG